MAKIWFPLGGRRRIIAAMNVVVEFAKKEWRKLLSLKDTPHAVAGGLAIGMLVGFTPLFGVKTLLALGLAWAVRCNPIAAVIAVSLHDLLIPVAPFMLRLEYDIGFWLFSHPHHFPPKLDLLGEHLPIGKLLEWTTFLDLGLPVLVGSLIVSIPMAVGTYFCALAFMNARAKRHKAKI